MSKNKVVDKQRGREESADPLTDPLTDPDRHWAIDGKDTECRIN